MKILAVADAEDRALADHFDRERWKGVDLLISCGDLDAAYLDYLVSQLNVPALYVRGNHDLAYADQPPPGWENIDGKLVKVAGLRIGGLEGSRWYGGRGVEHGESAMAWKALQLKLKIAMARGIDVFVTHAPPLLPPSEDEPAPDHVHLGFPVFTSLIEKYQPKLFLHGHTHLGYGRGKRERLVGKTRVIDCYGAHVITLD